MAKAKHNGNGHGHVTETPDVSHIKNIDVTHEASDVSVSALLKFVVGLTVMTVVVSVLMWGLFRFFNRRREKEPKPGPMAMIRGRTTAARAAFAGCAGIWSETGRREMGAVGNARAAG